jgi:hypothetical protein
MNQSEVAVCPRISGKTYRLDRSTNLSAGFDSVVNTNITATVPTNVVTDTVIIPGDTRFYRVGLEQRILMTALSRRPA